MSKHSKVKIYIKYDSQNTECNKKYNKDLIKHLNLRLDVFNRCGNFMDLVLCDENNNKCLTKLNRDFGIKRLPALIMVGREEKIYGTPDIKKIIDYLCRSQSPPSHKGADEMILEYQRQIVGASHNPDDLATEENDSPYETSFDDMARATVETQRRLNQYSLHDENNARGRRNMRNSKRPMNHRKNFGNPKMDPRVRNINNGPIFGDDNDENYDDFQENNYIKSNNNTQRNSDRGRIRMRDDPATIQRSLGHSSDNDLMAKFWDNQTETKT